MLEVTEATAGERARDLFNKGFTAIERNNYDYAVDLLLACLDMEPAFLRARKFLRAAAIRRFMNRDGNPRVRHALALARGLPHLVKYLLATRAGRHLEALKHAERLMADDPLQPYFIRCLGKAAESADMPEIAIQTLTLVREHLSDTAATLFWLGQLYLKTNQTHLALQCFEELVKLDPNNADGLKALKDTMAVNSINRDWEKAAHESFRAAIKDGQEAAMLEREAKAVKDESDIDTLIEESLSKIRNEPANVNYRRTLANLYANANRFDEAIEALEEAQGLGVARDPQIDQTIMQIRLRKLDAGIEALRKAGDAGAVEAARRERDDFRFKSVGEMVKRYPNDAALRFDLGMQYYEREQTNEAIQQFQAAQRSPKHRQQAIFYMAMCFKRKKQFDMAVEQLELAASESGAMNDSLKEILYQLGLVLLETGKKDRALEYFKKIYQADIAYKDVAQLIEAQYN